MARVLMEHVTKRFGEVTAVRDLTLEARDGEFLVLVGPSGCGKSTALRMIAGLEDTSEGDIFIGERNVTDVPPKDRDIAMVFQSYALYPHMSVYDNMAFGLKLRGTDKNDIRRRVNEAAEMLGIGPLLDRKPRQLSGGQRQRVAVGRAIVREPQAFLFDEPLSNLDAKLRVQTRADLIRLHQRLQTTSVYVTHDQVEAMTMGTRIAVMRDGLLQQLDTPQTLYDRPVNVFVAGFIGSPAMNFLQMGVRLEGDQASLFKSGDGSAGAADYRISLTGRHAHVLRPFNGRTVTLGIRPEDLDEQPPAGDADVQLPARVDVIEHLGSEAFLYADLAGTSVIARVPPHTAARPNEQITLYAPVDKVYLFDPESEGNLLLG